MRRHELQRVLLEELGRVVALPALDVPRGDGALFVVREVSLEALGRELDLAAVGAELVRLVGAALGVAGVGRVAGAALREPAQARLRLVVLGGVDDVVALLVEGLPVERLGQVGAVVERLGPVDLGLAAVGELVEDAELRGQVGEDLVVGLGLPERLDALLLTDDDAVVVARVRVRGVAAAGGELAEVVALEVGAGRQDDVGHAGLAVVPDVLVDDELELGALVHPHPLGGVGHGAHEGAAVAVPELDLGAALGRIHEVLELLLERLAAEAGAVPLHGRVRMASGTVSR